MLRCTLPYACKRNWLLLCVVLRSIQLPALSWAIAAIIDGPIRRGDGRGLVLGVSGFALLVLFTQLVLHFRQRLALELGEMVVLDLRNQLFAHLHRMTMSFFHRTPVGHILSHMTSDIESIRTGVQEVFCVSLVHVGQILVAGTLMLCYDPLLFLIVLAGAPLLWLLNRHFHRKLSAATRAMRESFGRVTASVAESVQGVRVTQAFAREEETSRRFHALVQRHSRNNLAVACAHGLFVPLLELNNQVFVAALLLIGSYRVLAPGQGTSVGSLIGFLFVANILFGSVAGLAGQYNQALATMAGAERLFAFFDTAPEWSDPPGAKEAPRLAGRVQFEHLGFAYQPGRPVLRDINLSVEPGQTVALVGRTGSGKTSLVNLLTKFALPTSGTLRIDGSDIRQIDTQSLRRQIGLVLQQNFLFQGTIAGNIRMARPQASEDEIAETARRLGCLELFESLPDGFHTPVSPRGENLSLGQRQLVCFTRAMLADPRILILDEATSNIDSLTEARIQRALEVLREGRTSFVVAHRLSTIRDADLVVVLDQGRIVECGDHEHLLALGGQYATLCRHFTRSR